MSGNSSVNVIGAQENAISIPAGKTLARIAANILKNPDDLKYHTIRTNTNVFKTKILPCQGGVQCLMEMGFKVNEGGKFTFDSSMINTLWRTHQRLIDMLHSKRVRVDNSLDVRMPLSLERMSTLDHNQIYQRLHSHMMHVNVFENSNLQEKARSCVPIDELKENATNIYNSRSNTDVKGEKKKSFDHIHLLQLLSWFKRDFFTWTDKPKCDRCTDGCTVESMGRLPPTNEEKEWDVSVVEGYKCSGCPSLLRFPRYNHPEKLLETRTGRCGEWANCFTLICRAMGFEARHVLDWTDHVWTEVFLENRWYHCDPCENVLDKPLMYERGWKKKLSLIVAANSTQIVDVTRRYCHDDRVGMQERRSKMMWEKWLQDSIKSFNSKIQNRMSEEDKEKVRTQIANEEAELEENVSTQANNEEYKGRTSGSLEWRVGRGETSRDEAGPSTSSSSLGQMNINSFDNVVIVPNNKEFEAKRFRLEYSPITDIYKRPISGVKEFCWDSLVCKSNNVMRKEELDWKQVYLCRNEDSKRGFVTWTVSLPQEYTVDRLSIFTESQTFHSGSVKWLLTSENHCDTITPGIKNEFKTRYSGCRQISLKAVMCDKDGKEEDCSWQHAQLFRRSTEGDKEKPSLVIDCSLTKH